MHFNSVVRVFQDHPWIQMRVVGRGHYLPKLSDSQNCCECGEFYVTWLAMDKANMFKVEFHLCTSFDLPLGQFIRNCVNIPNF